MDPNTSVQKKGSNNPFPEVFGADGSDEDLGNTISKKMHASKDATPNQAEQTKLGNSSGQSQSEPPKMGLLFGQSQTGGLFGTQSNGQTKTGGGLFAQATANLAQSQQTEAPKPTGGLFGASPITSSKPLFGQSQQGDAAKPTNPSEGQKVEVIKPTGLFAGSATTQSGEAAKPTSLFGAQTTEAAKPIGLFAGSTTQSGEAAKPASLFGSQTTNPLIGQQLQGEAPKPTGNIFGLSKPTEPATQGESPKPTSLFGAQTTEAPKPSGLFAGSTPAQSGEAAKPASLFGAQTGQTAKPVFGQSQQGEAPKPTSLFGAQTTESAKPSGLFAGSTPTQSGEAIKPASLFGAQTTEAAKPAGLFAGSTSAQSGEATKPASLFGAQTGQTAKPIFGQSQQGESPKPAASIFGQSKPTEPATQGESPKPTSLFGAQTTEAPKPSGLFAGSTPAQSGEATKPASLFGAQTTEAAKPAGLFAGSTSTQSGEAAKPASLFGAQTSKPLLGQQPQGEAPKPSGNIFGLSKPTEPATQGEAPKPASLFGTQATEAVKPAGLFAGTTPTQSGDSGKPSSLFGAQTAKSLLGQQSQGESPKPASLFGAQTTEAAKPAGLFAGSTPTQSGDSGKPSSLFGAQTVPTGKPLFGQPQQTEPSKPITLFGQQQQKTEVPDLPAPSLGKQESEIKYDIFGPISKSPVHQPPKTAESQDKESKGTPVTTNKPALFGQPAAQPSVFSSPSSSPFSGFTGMLNQEKSAFLDMGKPASQSSSLFSGVFNDSNPKRAAKPLFPGAKAGAETPGSQGSSQLVGSAEFDNPNTFKVAFEKEKRAQDKLAALMKGIEENKKLFSSTLQSQEQEIDAFFEEYTKKLSQKVLEAVEKCKQTLKAKLRSEHQNYDATSTQVHKLLAEISETNQFSKILDNIEKTEATKKYLANSFELKAGYTPLVKKYKLLKSTLPSVRSLTSQPKTKVVTKEDLLEFTEKITIEFEKSVVNLQKRLDHEIVRAPHPLQSFLGSIQAIAKATPSILPPKYPHDPSLGPHANVKNIKQVVYKLAPEEVKAVANSSIFPALNQIVYLTQPGSVQNDILEKDLISYQGAPRKIVKKVLSTAPDSFDELTLENIFDGKIEQVKLPNKQRQPQELVLTDDYIVTKVNQKAGHYTLTNIDNQKTNTRVQVKLASPDFVLGAKVKADLEKLLKEKKPAVVKTLFIDQEEIIVACDELRSRK